MYQYFYETEYDHVGICVLDKYGEPFLLEKTLNGVHKVHKSFIIFRELYLYSIAISVHIEWCIRQLWSSSTVSNNITSIAHNHHTDIYPLLNIQLRPFEKRILHSKAQQIMLIPVMPRESEEDEVAASERLQWRERDGLLGMHAGQSQGQGQGSNKDKGKNSNENENIVNSIDWEDRRGLLQEYVRRLLQVGGNSGGRAEGQKQVFVPYLPRLSAVPANRRPHPEIIEGGVEANKCRNMQEMAALYAEIGLTLKSGSAQGQKQKQRQTKRQKEKEKEKEKKQKSLSLSLKQLEEDAVLLKDSEGAGRVFSEQHIMVRTK